MKNGLLPGRPVPGVQQAPRPASFPAAGSQAPEERGISNLERVPSRLQGMHVKLETAYFLSGPSVQLFKQTVFARLIIDEASSCISCTVLLV